MSAYVIKLTEQQDEEEKERIAWCSKRKVYFVLASVLMFLAIFRLWLITHMVAAPNDLKYD